MDVAAARALTSTGVESTPRSACDLGYKVVLVVDAMTDRDAGAHRHNIEKTLPRLGETGTSGNVLKLLRGLCKVFQAQAAVGRCILASIQPSQRSNPAPVVAEVRMISSPG